MHVPSYLMSLLWRQQRLLGPAFFTQLKADWLVWEPGAGQPVRSELKRNTARTMPPGGDRASRPEGGDALCFELKRGPQLELTVGRSAENNLVVSDLTVSREQFSLTLEDNRWTVRVKTAAVSVNGKPVSEKGTPLYDRSVIAAGDVRLTFYGPEAFPERLAKNADTGT